MMHLSVGARLVLVRFEVLFARDAVAEDGAHQPVEDQVVAERALQHVHQLLAVLPGARANPATQ
eukprot:7385816-Prymnesium_polylepis.1